MLQKNTITLPTFDQVVRGDVIIKQICNKKYEITFTKIGKFLLYQVWSADNSIQQNENRSVKYVNAKEWVQNILETNKKLKDSGKPQFTPTTVMKIGCKKYVFVINKAKLNKDGHVVFEVSTKEIKLRDDTSKELLKIPHGHYKNVRFDIDSILLGGVELNLFVYLAITLNCSNASQYDLGNGFKFIIQLAASAPQTCSINGYSVYIVINTDTNLYYLFDRDFVVNFMEINEPALYNALQAALPNDALGTFFSSIVSAGS
jgi:hypothetical protein